MNPESCRGSTQQKTFSRHYKWGFNPNFGALEMSYAISVQMMASCSHRMVHLSKSCGGYCQSNEKQNKMRQVNSGLRSQHPMTQWRSSSKEHKNGIVWLSSGYMTQYHPLLLATLESCLRNPLPSILLLCCLMLTHKCSSMTDDR